MQHTILVIEDTNEILENITEMLQLREFAVIPASDGKNGVDLAVHCKPDLILCAVLMPEMNGYDVLKTLKETREMSEIPFVFITSQSARENIQRAFNLGASDYIVKPFDGDILLDRIDHLLHLH